MNYLIGVDGGGTKTAFAIADKNGRALASFKASGCSYREIGIEAAVKLICEGICECMKAASLKAEDCLGCCLGMPCFGESIAGNTQLEAALRAALPQFPLHIVNDVEVGHAGALGADDGIYIVAGTGSIALGKAKGNIARCGGWPEFFGDEGSCYWIGREAMSVFAKQADGRLPKGALYEIVHKSFSLNADADFMDLALENIIPYRSRVADFQRYACTAAENNDASAAAIFENAASELALLAKALKDKLFKEQSQIIVSYGGGLFKAGELILKPLEKRLANIDCILKPPKQSAVEGALYLAAQIDNRREK